MDDWRHRRIIIERVFALGNLEELKQVIAFYGIDTIRKEIIMAGNLDPKTLNWVSKWLDIPKSRFKCYIKRQSSPAHWNF